MPAYYLLLGLREDTVRLEHVVRGRIPQTQVHRPAGRDKAVVVGVKGHPRRWKRVVLGRFLHLQVRLGESPSRRQRKKKTEDGKEGVGESFFFKGEKEAHTLSNWLF